MEQAQQPLLNTSETKQTLEEKTIQSPQHNIEQKENFNNDPEKKDAIPLLIIDVNVKPGIKEKIYVYDGDTSEALALRFAQEHSKFYLFILFKI